MSDNNIQSILKDVLEEEIPSSQVNLWPAVRTDLDAGRHQPAQQGDRMNTLKTRRIPRFALATSLILALLVIFIATPQGRSFAQSVLELFTRVDSKTFPLEDSQIARGEPYQFSATALPQAPLISVAEAETQVGFKIAELSYVPDGFEYLGARLYGNNVSIEYQTLDYGHLLIMQSQEGFYQSTWDNVPGDAVVPVKIGESDGELITQGTFVMYPGETVATWNPYASLTRMRWVNNGVWFEIAVYRNAHKYIDLTMLIEIAESLAIQP